MARVRCIQHLSGWFVLFSLMTRQSQSIETVNVVDFCGQTIQGDGMIVKSHQESRKYYFVTMGTDCHLTMQSATPRDKVQFYFRFFLVYSLLRVSPHSPAPLFPESPRGSSSSGPTRPDLSLEPTTREGPEDPCHAGSYIQFYDGRDKSAPPIGQPLCGKSPPRPVLSTGNFLTLRLVTRGTQPRVDFVGDFTSFRLGFNQSECSGQPYFNCRNGKCIPMSLVCADDKGIDNCGDGSDLIDYPGCNGPLSTPKPPQHHVTQPAQMLNVPTQTVSTLKNCATPNAIPDPDSITDSQSSISLLALYVVLGVTAGGVLMCWCCWAPGWFLWRVSVFRFLPCCNSCCASCQLCGRSCLQNKDHRLAKVTPEGAATPVSSTTTVAVTQAVDPFQALKAPAMVSTDITKWPCSSSLSFIFYWRLNRKAKLTIFPTFATDEEVQMVCGGHENQHMSECMFYPAGQENFIKPSASCNFSITVADLIAWSQDQESSYVNISCYYTVHDLEKNTTSPHSDIVSVRVRGLASMPTLPPEGSPATMIPNGTIQDMSSLTTSDSNILTDPANEFPVTTGGPEIKKYSNTKMFYFIAVVASGGGIVLTGLVGICLFGCTRNREESVQTEYVLMWCVSVCVFISLSCNTDMVLLILLIFLHFLEVQPQNERPNIKVIHDSQFGQFRVFCEIAGSDIGGYTCFLSLGDEYPKLKKTQSHELSGKTQCIFTVLEYEFSNNLKPIKNKVLSCSYYPKNAPSKQSYSEKFNLTEEVQMVCGGHENQHMSECTFYPAGQENFIKPSASCNFFITVADLIAWSQDQESSYVNISCYYTVHSLGENTTSPHSDIVSVRIRVFPGMTEAPEIKKYSKMFFFFAVVATSGGIVLTVVLGSCLYGCTRNSEESVQTEVEPNHLYYTLLTKPTIFSNNRTLYSQLKVSFHHFLLPHVCTDVVCVCTVCPSITLSCHADMVLLILLIFTLFLEVQLQSTAFSDQSWLTASPTSIQKDSSTAQLKHDAQDSDLSKNEQPNIKVIHDSQLGQFRVFCEIPGSDNGGYTCFLSLGDEYPHFKKTDSHELSGKTQCIFTVLEYEFSNNLKLVKNKVVSCSYSPKNATSKRSYSDKFNLTAFFPTPSPQTTKGTYSTPTFSTSATTTEPKTTLATESSTCYETTINSTTGYTVETTHTTSEALSVTWNTTADKKTWHIMILAATSGGVFLAGLMGISLCCISTLPTHGDNQRRKDNIDANEERLEENEMKLYHVYCTIPDISTDTHELYSLAQMPKHPLPV
ncbi:Low-density lipoprotein receptor class A domain-containing protein 2 [Labeo rohita]|uniref:Low-density lipoprotein receptor class A domain-containing protein 2 n=2 Tax=Labeo rohita TaxID=84645 RepID=A0ABQ8M827_LABRO|nr:Low-density lipoprotein receptor class A domain-containing protein 2 [Labeo rohita]